MLLFMTVFLMILLFSSVYSFLVPVVLAAETTLQEKTVSIMGSVVGLNLAEYEITAQEYPPDSYLNVVPQENVRCRLESDVSKVDALCTFANGNLRMIHVLERTGSPRMTKSAANELEMAKVFLSNYEGYSRNSFYGKLNSMLDDVTVDKNSVATSGNVKLEITTTENATTFRWIYTFNGVDAVSKCVVLGYEKGFLKYFIDNWNIYNIGSTSINLSEEKAIELAMENAKTYSWRVGADNETYEVIKFNLADVAVAQLVFCSSLHANKLQRNQDLLTLYPMWRIGIALDKFYPGNVYGIYVDIWADTKEIRHIKEVFSTLDPPADKIATLKESAVGPIDTQASSETQPNSILIPWVALSVFTAFMLGTAHIWLFKKKLPKQRSLKVSGVILCLLLASTMLVSVSTVSADPRRRATVWGSESIGQAGRKTQAEINQQRLTAQHISDYFKNDGYYSSNYQGYQGSLKSQILSQIDTNEQNYDRVAVVDFNHGVGRTDYTSPQEWHYMFEDHVGTLVDGQQVPQNGVYDMDVYQKTGLRKTYFALINTCMSANISNLQRDQYGNLWDSSQGLVGGVRARGMPFAWTHGRRVGIEMSSNGYLNPDGGAHCYIGFPYGSASLSQQVDTDYPNIYYWMWVEDFLYDALSFEMTVIEALDHASYENFEWGFGDTDLYKGFTAIWPPMPEAPNSTMAVYGNGYIRLYEYFVHSPYVSYGTYGSGLVSNPNGFTGAQPDYSLTRLRALQVGDQAVIVGSMGYSGANLANGHIWVHGYSSGYTSRLRVYVSYYSGSGWQWVTDVIISPGAAGWIDCGTWSSNFRYISFAVYRQNANDYSNDVYLNTVLVLPPLPNP